jgi:hypothetical protein
MTLAAASDMRRDPALKGRIESAALANGQTIQWVDRNIAALCANTAWATKWADFKTAAAQVGDLNPNVGIRTDVIGDDDIDAAVKQLVSDQEQAAAATTDTASA